MKEGKRISPPALATRLFEWYCGRAQVEDIQGDVDEMFIRDTQRMSPSKAKLKYWSRVFSLLFSYAIKKRRERASFHPHSQNSFSIHMISNYFKIARRTMMKNKVYSLINVLGLTLGTSACLIVYLIVSHEFSFDRFHPDRERIYRVTTGQKHEQDYWKCICVAAPAFTTIRDEFAGAEAIAGYHKYDAKVTIAVNGQEKRFDRNSSRIIITNPEYFNVFKYQWLAGSQNELVRPNTVVLTENRALAYFGSVPLREMIGKEVIYNDSLNVTVTGVVKDWTENSDFNFTEFISFNTIEASFLRKDILLDNWGMLMHSSQSFIKLKKDSDPNTIAQQLSGIIKKNSTEAMELFLQPLENIHFANNDEEESSLLPTLYALAGLAIFILIIASINFINLSTAQSIQRVKEIGIRKAMGSRKRQIIFQFLSETLVIAFFAVCLSLLLLNPLLSLFEKFVPRGVTFNPFTITNWMFLTGMLIIVSLLAGIYPAVILSSYRPAISLSGKIINRGRERWSLRKSLIVFQFAFSLFFIIATVVIQSQLTFIQTSDRGFSTESVVTFRTNWMGKISTVEALSERLRQLSGIQNVTMQSFSPMGFAQMTSTAIYQSNKEKIQLPVSIKSGDENFVPLYQIRLKAGRNLSATDSLHEVIINEVLLQKLGFKVPEEILGEQILMDNVSYSIIGVAENFHERSFHDPIGPALIGNFSSFQHAIAVKLNNETDQTAVLAAIEHEFKSLYPDETFDYHFIEDEIGWMHDQEKKTSHLARVAMFITIFISCMGFFGLAMFTTEMKIKEIGIRKVLGATPFHIGVMLNKEFVLLILLAIGVASPIAWYVMNKWLLGFSYRTTMSAWIFIVSGIIALIIGLATVSYQSLKAALADPVNSLRSE
jgi:putative ABC transport system permease protein